MVSFTAGKTFRVVDSPNIRKIYNLQHPLSAVENMQLPALLNKQLQESASAVTSQTPFLSQLKQCPSSATTDIQSPALTNKQYQQLPIVTSPVEPPGLIIKLPQTVSSQTVSLHDNNQTNAEIEEKKCSKIKRRKTNENNKNSTRGILFFLVFVV